MKIINIHIIGFGKIQNTTYNLNDLNQIIACNGHGKTTLATFIECMFFGMNSTSKDNHRRYLPWNKSVCGGSITFCYNQKTYKMERTFGSKKSEDTFALFNSDNQPSLDFTSNIGEEIFGVDRKTFLSCCFYSLDTDFAFNDQGVYSRLNGIITQSDSLEDFDKKTLNLEKQIKEYENAQHKGIIPTIRIKLEEIKDKIAKLTPAKTFYPTLLKEKEDLQQSITNLKSEILKQEKIIENILASNSPQSKIGFLDRQIQDLQNKILQEKSKINNQEITKTDLDKIITEKQQLLLLDNELNSLNNQLAILNATTQTPLPTQEELEIAKQNYLSLQTLQTEKTTKANSRKVNIGLSIMLILISIMIVIIGVRLTQTYLILSVSFYILAIVFLILAITTLIKNPLKNYTDKIQKKHSFITEFLFKYGYGGYDFFNGISLIESRLLSSNDKIIKLQDLNSKIATIEKQKTQINEHIHGFFSGLGLNYNNFTLLQETVQNIEFFSSQLKTLNIEKQSITSNNTLKENLELIKQKGIKENLLINKENLEQKLSEINLKTLSTKNDLTQLENLNQDLKATWQELETALQEKDILQKTLYCLNVTKQNLTRGCLEPIKQVFNDYGSKILTKYTNFNINENFLVTFSHNGITRDFNDLSLGEKQVVFLCFRLGIIYALFKNDMPFFIIDDAFAPLDENNLLLVKSLLKEMAKNIQILYLAPTPNRKL